MAKSKKKSDTMTKGDLIEALQADDSPMDTPMMCRTSDDDPYFITEVSTFRGALCIQEDSSGEWPEEEESDDEDEDGEDGEG